MSNETHLPTPASDFAINFIEMVEMRPKYFIKSRCRRIANKQTSHIIMLKTAKGQSTADSQQLIAAML